MNERVIPARMKTQRWSSKERTAQRMGGEIQYDYGFRVYNPSIARFLSVDPLSPEYPELTPYQFASNTPILCIDLDGLEAVPYNVEENLRLKKNKPEIHPWGSEIYATNFHAGVANGYLLVEQQSGSKTVKDHFKVSGMKDSKIPMLWKLETKDLYHAMSMSIWYGSVRLTDTKLQHRDSWENHIPGEMLIQLTDSGILPDGERKIGSHILNTFRHQSWMAISTIMYGEDFSKMIGDAHERSGDGFTSLDNDDAIVDLLNNAWGREAGKEFSANGWTGKDLGDPNKLSDFLNQLVGKISQDIPEMKNIEFSADQKSVQNLSKKIKQSLNVDVPE